MENTTKLESSENLDNTSGNVLENTSFETKVLSKGSFTKKERITILRAITMMSQIAFTVIACVVVGLIIGRLLDNWLNTAPWLLIVFLLLGIVSAFKAMIDVAKKF